MGAKKTKSIKVDKLHLSSTRKFPTSLLEEALGVKVVKNRTFKPILFLYRLDPELIKAIDGLLKPSIEVVEGKRYLQYHALSIDVVQDNDIKTINIVIKTWRA